MLFAHRAGERPSSKHHVETGNRGVSRSHQRRPTDLPLKAMECDKTRPFVIVLSERSKVDHPLLPPAHLGVACESREEVDRLCEVAHGEGRLINGPRDAGPPIGYLASIRDPDGHTLEVSFGQEVGLTIQQAT